jgi:transcriptional regulator with GAF, ATPase, and Fis domain
MPKHDGLLGELLGALRGVLAQVAEPNHVLALILEESVKLSRASRGVFVEVSAGGHLTWRVLHRYRADLLEDPGHYSRSVFESVLASGEDLVLDNAAADPRFLASRSVQSYRMASVLCMPIRSEDRIVALVHLESGQLGHFKESHRRLLRPLLDISAPVLEALSAGRAILDERDRLRNEVVESRGLLAREWSFGQFVGRSPVVRALEDQITRAASSDFPVLLLGETGTGKNILARVLHSASPRAQQPFVTVFCPSLERSMVEAELFGHRRGAFTGAVSDRVGKVQIAQGGTLFLDEIGELPIEVQPKLLRILQEGTYERLGDPEERRVDVRVIAATNRALDQEVREGRFRRDLYERLNFVPVRVPPLRKRREDVPALLRHALDRTPAGRWIELTDDANALLVDLDLPWPGNVRHLEHLAARLTLEMPARIVSAEDLRRVLDAAEMDGAATEPQATLPPIASMRSDPESEMDLADGLPSVVRRAERACLEEAMRRHPGMTRAELASLLKIGEATLFKKLRQHGLN